MTCVKYILLILATIRSCSSLTLNPLERLTLNDRINTIQSSIQKRLQTEATFSNDDTGNGNKKRSISIIFPGAGGPDQFTQELQSTISSYSSSNINDNNNNNHQVLTFDWSEHRGSLLTAGYDSEAVGESVGEVIHKELGENLGYIHCIGISVGGFAGNACAQTICNFRKKMGLSSKDMYVRLTLLDPFCSRGVLGSGYGESNFGLEMDYADQYLNTDDPVPTTNDPLSNCACIDVTGATERNDFILPPEETMHCWPLVYFARFGYEESLQFTQDSGNDADKGDNCLIFHGRNGAPKRGSVEKRR